MVNLRRQNIQSKIKYYISNKKDKETETETIAIIEKNKITYKENDILVSIIIDNNNISFIRENKAFKQIIKFCVNKKTISEYYIKDMNYSLEFNVITTKLEKEKNHIYIEYLIEETNEEYKYELLYEEEK